MKFNILNIPYIIQKIVISRTKRIINFVFIQYNNVRRVLLAWATRCMSHSKLEMLVLTLVFWFIFINTYVIYLSFCRFDLEHSVVCLYWTYDCRLTITIYLMKIKCRIYWLTLSYSNCYFEMETKLYGTGTQLSSFGFRCVRIYSLM